MQHFARLLLVLECLSQVCTELKISSSVGFRGTKLLAGVLGGG